MAAAPKKVTAVKVTSLKQSPPLKQADVKGKAPASKQTAARKAAPPAKTARKSTPPAKATPKTAAPKIGTTKTAATKTAATKTAATKTGATKTAATKTAATKTGTTRTVAVKKAAARRPAARTTVPTPAARRARTAAAPRKSPKAASRNAPAPAPAETTAAPPGKTTVNPPQVFTVSHLDQTDFKVDGLRTYARYRDLGIAAATGGLCQAHVIRFTPPCTDEVRKRHMHEAELQLVYVLQGWMKNEFEGHGEQMMSAGSCWLQPSGIKHTVLDYSADCEVLEIIVPADFKTEELA
jgi:uncharacterized RmlC-like cupin family protein